MLADFPFGLHKSLRRDPDTGHWTCRYLVPRDQREGSYRIHVRIVLPHGDWVDTFADYVVDETPPRFAVTSSLVGRTLHWRAVPVSGVFENTIPAATRGDVFAAVIPDVMSVILRPPQGGYVVLERQPSPDSPVGWAWVGTYDLPDWYRAGTYRFRFLAMDEARNTFSTEVEVVVPGAVSASWPIR